MEVGGKYYTWPAITAHLQHFTPQQI